MAQFDDLVEAQLAGLLVRAAPLVHFDFRSGPKRVWPGFGKLEAGGETWSGIGDLGALTPITSNQDGTVDEITLSLFGDQRLLQNISADAADSVDRDVNIWLQFFNILKTDKQGRYVDWQTLSDPISLFWGRMGPLTVQRNRGSKDERATRIVSVIAHNAFINGARPRFTFFSDVDQKARTGGTDQIFVRVSEYTERTIRWPVFA